MLARVESEEADDADVFNQISRDLNLDLFARQWHREEFMYSQVVVGVWWARKTYTVRGRTLVEDAEANKQTQDQNQQMLAAGQVPPQAKPKMKKGPKRLVAEGLDHFLADLSASGV